MSSKPNCNNANYNSFRKQTARAGETIPAAQSALTLNLSVHFSNLYKMDDLSGCGCRYRSKMTWCDTLVELALLAYSLAPLSAAARHSNVNTSIPG
ncbi:hypothetical protein J6590_023035 [Homalodisca vitripennis]|nr:hypothetical protein J6590_023035 [Homalodisca vitripennis]